jgi:hypothetical protein
MPNDPIGLLTPDTWHLALQAALDAYKVTLQAWKADPNEANLKAMELAAAHVDAIETQRPPELELEPR